MDSSSLLGILSERLKCQIVSGSNLVQHEDQLLFVNKAQWSHSDKSDSAIFEYSKLREVDVSVERKESVKKINGSRKICQERERRHHHKNISVDYILSYEDRADCDIAQAGPSIGTLPRFSTR